MEQEMVVLWGWLGSLGQVMFVSMVILDLLLSTQDVAEAKGLIKAEIVVAAVLAKASFALDDRASGGCGVPS